MKQNMIDLKKVDNLITGITKFLTKRRKELRLPPTDVTPEPPKILTQEKDGTILFTWDDVSQGSKGAVVTHVGLYDPGLQKHEVVWTYNQRVKIVSCSINQGRSLIAFTVLTRDESQTTKKDSKDTYTAFLAEIKAPSTRVFSLNLTRPHFLKVQFLYENPASERESHMIVMLHRESIGLYDIQLGRAGEKGVIMKDQPKTKQLVRKFFWCQWDSQHQRLYYIHYRKHVEDEKTHIQPMLSSLQFYQNAQYDNILDVPLSFPFPHIRASSRYVYTHDMLDHGIPDPFLNVSVLTQANGTFCICHQHLETPYSVDRRSPVKRTRKSPAQITPSPLSLPSSVSESDDDTMDINYYVCMVHHAKTLHGCVSGLPYSRKYRLHFSWHGDYLMVLLPGHFVHLLNVGIEYEPCHHILLHDKISKVSVTPTNLGRGSTTPDQSESPEASHGRSSPQQQPSSSQFEFSALSVLAERMNSLTNACLYEIMRDMPTGGCLYSYKTGEIWKVTLNLDALVTTFVSCYMGTSRQALLHYVVTRTRDFFLVKRIFEMISNDIASMEVPGLLAEFLIGTTYTSMRRQIDRESLRLLPFTTCETFRGQFEKNLEGERVARVSYSSLPSINIGTKTARERQQKRGSYGEDLWDILRRHLRWIQMEKHPRFSHKTVKRQIEKLQRAQKIPGKLPGMKSTGTNSEGVSFLSSLHNHRKRSESPGPTNPTFSSLKRVRPDTVLGQAPPFLQGSSITESSSEIMALTKNILTNHMNKYTSKDIRLKGETVANEFVTAQTQQSRQLCHLLWTLRGPLLPHTDLDYLPNLTDPSTEDEYELFQLYQRYYQTCQDLAYPLPLGFVSYFTALGYRNLSMCLFLQYVDRGILQLTGDFLAQVLADISNDDEGFRIKQQIIARLPQPFAEECYKQWNHPVCQRYFAHKQVSDLLAAKDFSKNGLTGSLEEYSPRKRANSAGFTDTIAFQPLVSFLNMLERLEHQQQRSNQSTPLHPGSTPAALDFHTLEDVALYYTKTKDKCDMSAVNF